MRDKKKEVDEYALHRDQLEESTGFLIRDAYHKLTRLLRVRLASHNLTPGQWFFLRHLWLEDGISQRVLSDRVGMTEATTNNAIQLLRRNRLVKRVRNPRDRRSRNVFLTQKALRLKSSLLPEILDINSVVSKGMNAAERKMFHSLLRRLRDNLD